MPAHEAMGNLTTSSQSLRGTLHSTTMKWHVVALLGCNQHRLYYAQEYGMQDSKFASLPDVTQFYE